MKTKDEIKPKTLDDIIKENPPKSEEEIGEITYPDEDEEERLDNEFDEEE